MIGQNDNPYPPGIFTHGTFTHGSLPKSPFIDLISRISSAVDAWFCGLFRRKNKNVVHGSYVPILENV
jgi:hypothetical protein